MAHDPENPRFYQGDSEPRLADEQNPRFYQGDSEPGLADDNQRAIAMLLITKTVLEGEFAAIEADFIDVQQMYAARFAAIDAEVARRRGYGQIGAGTGDERGLSGSDRPRHLPDGSGDLS